MVLSGRKGVLTAESARCDVEGDLCAEQKAASARQNRFRLADIERIGLRRGRCCSVHRVRGATNGEVCRPLNRQPDAYLRNVFEIQRA